MSARTPRAPAGRAALAGVVAALVLAAGLPARAQDAPDAGSAVLAEALAELDERDPPVEELREAAVRRAGLAPARARAWARRARLAGLLPGLTLRALRSAQRDEGLRVESGVPGDLRVDLGDDLVLEARLTWDLERVVFDPAEIRAAREGARQAAARRELEMEVTRRYYERRRAQTEMILDPPRTPAERARRRLEIDELTAGLDALCGGALRAAGD